MKKCGELSEKHAESTRMKNDLKQEGDSLVKILGTLVTEFQNSQKRLNTIEAEQRETQQKLDNSNYNPQSPNVTQSNNNNNTPKKSNQHYIN